MALHRFSRTELLIGKEGLKLLKESSVAVFGLGGVGAYTAEALARAGIGKITLVDYDDICITNINRQIHAVSNTVGQPKVEAMKERILAINPEACVTAYKEFVAPGNVAGLIRDDYSYIVDSIDTVSAKIEIITKALARNIPVVSCMGAGNKFDPTRFQVADISKTHTCPLAKVIRQELKKRGITSGLKVVFSTEKPTSPLEGVGDCRKHCVCPNRGEVPWNCTKRRQIPGSISFVPPVAGLILAGVVVCDLLGMGSGRGEPL